MSRQAGVHPSCLRAPLAARTTWDIETSRLTWPILRLSPGLASHLGDNVPSTQLMSFSGIRSIGYSIRRTDIRATRTLPHLNQGLNLGSDGFGTVGQALIHQAA